MSENGTGPTPPVMGAFSSPRRKLSLAGIKTRHDDFELAKLFPSPYGHVRTVADRQLQHRTGRGIVAVILHRQPPNATIAMPIPDGLTTTLQNGHRSGRGRFRQRHARFSPSAKISASETFSKVMRNSNSVTTFLPLKRSSWAKPKLASLSDVIKQAIYRRIDPIHAGGTQRGAHL